jgi:hypothetical protein
MAKKPTKPKAEPAPLREPRVWEADAMKHAKERYLKRRHRVESKVRKDENGHVRVEQPHSDQNGWTIQQLNAFGTTSPGFLNSEVMRLINAVCPGEVREERVNAALAVLDGVQPENEVEAMLAVQMAATHALMMQMASNAGRSDMIPHLEASGNLAVKFARTFTAQIEALAKLRRPPEQRVIVEHVHVHNGGQAIVGTVTHAGGTGGGVALENGRQAHATDTGALAFAPGSPVWSEDAEREAVRAGGSVGQGPVPDARRRRGLGSAARPGKRELSARQADAGNGDHAAGAADIARRAGEGEPQGHNGSDDDSAA